MRRLVVRWARVSCARVCVRVSCGTRRSEKVALSERVASKSARAYPMLGGQWARGRLTHGACRDRTRSNRGGCLLKHASSRRPDRRIGEAGAYALFGYARASRQHVDGWCCTRLRGGPHGRQGRSVRLSQARVRQAGLFGRWSGARGGRDQSYRKTGRRCARLLQRSQKRPRHSNNPRLRLTSR